MHTLNDLIEIMQTKLSVRNEERKKQVENIPSGVVIIILNTKKIEK